jgi:hypothetical protein
LYFATPALELAASYAARMNEYRRLMPNSWVVSERPTRWFSWLVFRNTAKRPPMQGWKIHLSCAASDSIRMANAVLPVLLGLNVAAFKLPISIQGVLLLNANLAGRSQAGKVLTIYPSSNDEARAIITELRSCWSVDSGPAILSDIPVASACPIYLRYGVFFSESPHFDSLGRPSQRMVTPDGGRCEDTRTLRGEQPSWAPDPPLPPAVKAQTLDGTVDFELDGAQYIHLSRLGSGMRNDVVLALSVRDLELVVVKRARRGVMGDLHGYDAISRLRNEYDALNAVRASAAPTAAPLSYAEDPEQAVLVQRYLAGVNLKDIPRSRIIPCLASYCTGLRQLHSAGVVHRDVKLSNAVLVGNVVHLVDFELAAPVGRGDPIPGGTPGHLGPEGASVGAAGAADAYSFGASVFEALTGISPAQVPIPNNRGRLLGILGLIRQRKAIELVQGLTCSDPARRQSLYDAQAVLETWGESDVHANARQGRATERALARRFHRFAYKAAISAGLKTRDYIVQQEVGATWRNAHVHAGYLCQGLNIGAAGIVLGLVTLDTALRTNYFAADVYSGAKWLANETVLPEAHGLFTGNAGVALALGVVGRRLSDRAMVTASMRRLEEAAKQAGDFDLFSGSAGIVWAGCLLQGVLGSDRPLQIVERQAQLLHSGVMIKDGIPVWPSSRQFNPGRVPYYGAAHGASGSAMALAAWAHATSCSRSAEISYDVFDALVTRALGRTYPALPEGPGRPPRPPSHWCHGTAGLLWCLLEARNYLPPKPVDHVDVCLSAVVESASLIGNPTYCHGIAGFLELLRMADQASPNNEYLGPLRDLSVGMLQLLFQRRSGSGFWSSEHPMDVTPDLWVGFLGPAASLALQGAGESVALMSAHWLRRCSGRVAALHLDTRLREGNG